ncbi:MAG: hypothetical protein H3C26_10635 [Rhodocyclaceae bacterium]|nr:hypothetical protein [Rhodocyclaceae bacterium]
MSGMTNATESTCELAQWVLAEIEKRRRIGEPVKAMVCGIGAEKQALRMAEAGARVLLLSDRPAPPHVDIAQLPAAGVADPQAPLPLEPFDLILDQRTLCALRYDEARQALRRRMTRLRIGGKLFLSLYGIHSELGDHYADGGKLVGERFAPVAPALAERYGLAGPVCLYSERNLFSLLMEAGGAVIKTSTSALGHVRGVAARV